MVYDFYKVVYVRVFGVFYRFVCRLVILEFSINVIIFNFERCVDVLLFIFWCIFKVYIIWNCF